MLIAINIVTGKKMYSNPSNSLGDFGSWFSHPDGKSYECTFLMDNKEFKELQKANKVKIIQPYNA